MRIRLIISILTLCLGALSAQSAERVDTVQVRLYFKQGYSILEQGYCDNKAHLGTFSEKIADLQKDSLVQIRSVRITGSASPEGNTKLNNALSRKRANTAASFINQLLPFHPVEIEAKGIDWDALLLYVENSDIKFKDATLDVLKNTPEWVIGNGVVLDGKKRQLGIIGGGDMELPV